jgi:hypothetical protein
MNAFEPAKFAIAVFAFADPAAIRIATGIGRGGHESQATGGRKEVS